MSKIKSDSFATADSKSYKSCLVRLLILYLSRNKYLTQFSVVYSKSILVKRLSTSKLAMTCFQSVLVIALANAKESLTVHSVIVNGDKLDTRNFANLYDGVLIASNIGLKDGQLLMTGLCTLAWPHKIPGRHPTDEIFLYNISVRLYQEGFIMEAFKNVFNFVLRIKYKIQIFVWRKFKTLEFISVT